MCQLKTFHGTLSFDGHILFPGIAGSFKFSKKIATFDALSKPWSGSLELPADSTLQAGGPYDMAFDDGRSCRVLVQRSAVSYARPVLVDFHGAGPIE